MKKRLLIACGINKPEIERILARLDLQYDIIWMDGKLHNFPKKLNAALRNEIDKAEGYDEIILSFGHCGNAIGGITATKCDVLYLDTEDCVESFLFRRQQLSDMRTSTYFVSEGWLSSEHGLYSQNNDIFQKYGEETAKWVIKTMYANYKNLLYIITEPQVSNENCEKAEVFAELTGLKLSYEDGWVDLYEQLLQGIDGGMVKRLLKGSTIEFEFV